MTFKSFLAPAIIKFDLRGCEQCFPRWRRIANTSSDDGGRGQMSMKQVDKLNHMRVISQPLADVKRIAIVGKGMPAEVLEPGVQAVLREKSPLVVDHRDLQVGLDRHVQASAKVRRQVLRRMLAADVAGLALAGLLSLLLVSAISNDPSNSLSRLESIYLFNLAVIPL